MPIQDELAISQADYEAAESQILETIDRSKNELLEVSRTIHSNPETAYNEHKAAALLAQKLEEKGFQVQRKAADLDTAFIATAGREASPTIAVLAEYDALPVIGHACGHNLMATAALGAGFALRSVIDKLPGRVAVFGTPAEEGGGGKVVMVNRGAFKEVDAALIFHPSTINTVGGSSLAATRVNVAFRGRASHAAAAPDKGINALDAVIQMFNAANALRQQLRDDARVMGIITNGGQAANIIPDFASAHFSIRAKDRKYADEVLAKFRRCAEGAALATGATLEFTVLESSRYDNMVNNGPMARVFEEKLQKLGLEVDASDSKDGSGSTDMGNVSQVVPSIHPYLAIAPVGVNAHSIEFREAAGSERGQETMLNAARALALTALDLLAKPALLQQARQDFAEQAARGFVIE
ncbi:MAG TPA: M20 family metallopeptidase [Chloroflexia bacterium]|nr:M20 family metallopeptidase [Chloroflexia bacterium]